MPKFLKESIEQLNTCHADLQMLFIEVIKHWDCKIICGSRDEEEQNKAFEEGKSKKQFPFSNHNKLPSDAADAVPYPIIWENKNPKDLARWYAFAGFVLGVASQKGIKIRWGGDWDSDKDFKDQKFDDLPHFERRDI